MLTSYLEFLWDQGSSRSEGSRVVCGIQWLQPKLKGPTKSQFPAASAALAGWEKQEPGMSRPPVPYVVAQAVVVSLIDLGYLWHGLVIALLFETYLRSGEMLRLRRYQAVPPPPAYSQLPPHVAILASPEELVKPSKTGIRDVSILLDLPREQPLARVLVEYARRNSDQAQSPDQMLWEFTYPELRLKLGLAVQQLGLESMGITLHCLRHGGPSHDRATGARSLEEVQSRGCWRQSASVQRYEKHARLSRQVALIPASSRNNLQLQAERYERDFETLFGPHFAVLKVAGSSSK